MRQEKLTQMFMSLAALKTRLWVIVGFYGTFLPNITDERVSKGVTELRICRKSTKEAKNFFEPSTYKTMSASLNQQYENKQ
jgi:hypothetical protein